MIKFLAKGLLRDKNRSLYPIIVVALGVWLTVFFQAYLTGFMGEWIDTSSRFDTGHVKVMTRAYAENKNQLPNDLAIIEVNDLISNLQKDYPTMDFVERINFGGLLDSPDEFGETKKQGVVAGIAVDLISENTQEIDRLNIRSSLKRGRLPEKPNEVLLSDEFAKKLEVDLGLERRTLLSGISQHYTTEELVGKKVVVVANLKPATIMGVESQGMVLAGSLDAALELVTLENLPAGTEIS